MSAKGKFQFRIDRVKKKKCVGKSEHRVYVFEDQLHMLLNLHFELNVLSRLAIDSKAPIRTRSNFSILVSDSNPER